VRSTVSAKLRRMGYNVTAVITPAEAIANLQSGQKFVLVFTDIIMPGPMNGADLAREIAKRWPETKVLATSGYTESAGFGKVALPPGLKLLPKPYANTELAAALQELLGEPSR